MGCGSRCRLGIDTFEGERGGAKGANDLVRWASTAHARGWTVDGKLHRFPGKETSNRARKPAKVGNMRFAVESCKSSRTCFAWR